jgi:manganese/zinc/iron transport system ATP- binding protein
MLSFDVRDKDDKNDKVNYVVETNNLCVSYGKNQILKDFSCRFPVNQIIGIVGANGSGKSTLVKALMRIVPIEKGKILIFGEENIRKIRQRIAYLPQRNNVDWDFPASVLDVVLMGFYKQVPWYKPFRKKHKALALSYLEKVQMVDFANKHISELSGGQQQRVFLARAFAQEPDLLILDEPLVGVDAYTEKIIVELLQELKKKGKSILMIHHHVETFKDYFDYLLMLKDGKKVAFGKTEDIFNDETLYQVFGFRQITL